MALELSAGRCSGSSKQLANDMTVPSEGSAGSWASEVTLGRGAATGLSVTVPWDFCSPSLVVATAVDDIDREGRGGEA